MRVCDVDGQAGRLTVLDLVDGSDDLGDTTEGGLSIASLEVCDDCRDAIASEGIIGAIAARQPRRRRSASSRRTPD